jgi:hypothetical protein
MNALPQPSAERHERRLILWRAVQALLFMAAVVFWILNLVWIDEFSPILLGNTAKSPGLAACWPPLFLLSLFAFVYSGHRCRDLEDELSVEELNLTKRPLGRRDAVERLGGKDASPAR